MYTSFGNGDSMNEKKGILKVFISSTYRDLKEVRGLLIQRIEETLEAVAMERFLPGNGSPHERTIEFLEQSDICVFIVEDYYGSLIEDCKIRTDKCMDCNGYISYTHCEYRRAMQADKPHIVYLIENDILSVLSKVERFDLESTEEYDIHRFLKENDIDGSKIRFFKGYSLDEVEELWEVARNRNEEGLKIFKDGKEESA